MIFLRLGLIGSANLLLLGTSVLSAKVAPRLQAPPSGVASQGATAPAFELATVRPADPDDSRQWFGVRVDASGRVQASAVPLNMLVQLAYSAPPTRLKVAIDPAAPKWVGSQAFDIQAKIDEKYIRGWDKLSDMQRTDALRPTLQRFLAERFHLKLAVETRLTPVYALVQAKGGAHVEEVPPPAAVDGDATEISRRWMNENPGKTFPGTTMCSGNTCTGHAVKMSDVIGQIAANSRADRMVVDETGLTGYYDLSFSYPSREEELPMQVVGDELGMRFVPRSVPIQTYVIQSADKPSVDGAEGS